MLGGDFNTLFEQEQNNSEEMLQNQLYPPQGILSDLDQRFIDSVNSNQLEKAQSLLNLGADVYAKDRYGNPALFIAIRNCNLEMIEFFSQHSDVNDPRNTKKSITPLMEAILWGEIKAVEALLLANANVHATDKQGKTAVVYALEFDKYTIADLLEKNGANLNLLEQRLKDIHDNKKVAKIEFSDEFESSIKIAMDRVQALAFKKGTSSITIEEEKELSILLGNHKTNPVLAKKKLSWAFIMRATSAQCRDAYLANFTKVSYPIGNDFCEVYDLTEADDYRFIVNGFTCNRKNLNELIQGERKIIESSCYISASLIDKTTAVCNSIGWPPIHLALVVHPNSIVATYECDVKSPLGQNNEEQKGGYLIDELSKRTGMELRQAEYHSRMFDVISKQVSLPYELNSVLEQDHAYARPCDHSGSIPLESPDELLRRTKNYNEMIIMGNPLNPSNQKIKGSLLLLEKSETDKYSKLFKDEAVELLKNMEEETNGRIKLALIDTKRRKFSLTEDIKRINAKIYQVNAQLQKITDNAPEDACGKEKEADPVKLTLSLFELQKKLTKFKKKEKALLDLTEDAVDPCFKIGQ